MDYKKILKFNKTLFNITMWTVTLFDKNINNVNKKNP